MKKHPKANLEKKRIIFFQIGLTVSLALTLVAFEWTTFSHPQTFGGFDDNFEYLEAELVDYNKPIQEKTTKKFSMDNKKAIIDKVNLVDDKGDDKKKAIDEFTITFTDPSEFGDCLDCDEIKEDDLGLIIDASRVQVKPYYLDCENILDQEAQANCSYARVKEFINRTAKYPENARHAGIKGRVWMSFVVDKKGNITDVKVERGVHSLLDNEAQKAVEKIPSMIPAKQMGKAVPVRFMIPVDFVLR